MFWVIYSLPQWQIEMGITHKSKAVFSCLQRNCLVSRRDLRVGSGYSSTVPSPGKQQNPSTASHLCSHSLLCREQCTDDNRQFICSTVNFLLFIYIYLLKYIWSLMRSTLKVSDGTNHYRTGIPWCQCWAVTS